MRFDLQPTLKGKVLRLRPLRLEDFEPLFAAASDPQIWAQHPDCDRWQRAIFQHYFDTAMESGGAFAILERESERVIGSSRYCNLQEGAEVEIGWTFLTREFWGGVYNRELKTLMLDHAFRFVPRVLFVVGEKNRRSRKAVEKIGGLLVGEAEMPGSDGNLRRNVVFAIERNAQNAL